MKIAIWGDSITWGANDEFKGGWVNRLDEWLSQGSAEQIAIHNMAICGEKIGDVLHRFNREFSILKPDVVMIAVGINDSPHNFYPEGTSLNVFENKYSELARQSKKVVEKVILVGLTNVDDYHPKNSGYTNESIGQYSMIVKNVAIQNKLPYADLWNVIPKEDLQIDGLHPDFNGHAKISEVVSNVVDSIV